MSTQPASGTKSVTVGTEHVLTDIATPGTYIFYWDCSNMQDYDVVELKVTKVGLTGGSNKIATFDIKYDTQHTWDAVHWSIPITCALTDTTALEMTIKQTYGTARSYDWWVEKI